MLYLKALCKQVLELVAAPVFTSAPKSQRGYVTAVVITLDSGELKTMRPAELQLHPSRHFADVVLERYGTEAQEEASSCCVVSLMPGPERLRGLALDGKAITSSVGKWSDRLHCPLLTDVDLAKNKFRGWEHVAYVGCPIGGSN